MDRACAEAQKSRYLPTVPTIVSWAGKSDAYMTW